jgi:hypothetical protein
MESEETFAIEAQDEALLSRGRTPGPEDTRKSGEQIQEHEIEQDESSPLIAQRPRPPSSNSYQRAIDEPWHGAHGSADLPWYKKPSVSIPDTRGDGRA